MSMTNYSNEDIVVYVLVRTDLPSLNSGKGMAQVHHSGVQLAMKYGNTELFKNYIAGGTAGDADNFSTTITLAATFADIEKSIAKLDGTEYVRDIIVDPTYPFLVDLEIDLLLQKLPDVTRVKQVNPTHVLYTRRELTCAYALGYRTDEKFKSAFDGLELFN
jgi:hypothetical protein